MRMKAAWPRLNFFQVRLRVLMTLIAGMLFILSIPQSTWAADVRVIDASGLVRGAKVVKENATIIVSCGADISVQCIATNVDGVERQRQTDTKNGVCRFDGVPPGTWQIEVKPGVAWRVKIDG